MSSHKMTRRKSTTMSPIEIAIGDGTKVGIIILTALLMRCGAKIEADHIKMYVTISKSFNCPYCLREIADNKTET